MKHDAQFKHQTSVSFIKERGERVRLGIVQRVANATSFRDFFNTFKGSCKTKTVLKCKLDEFISMENISQNYKK